jgi:hypothetical protein
MVKAPAKTGRDINRRILATTRHQQYKGILKGFFWAAHLIQPTVHIKFIEPSILPIPAMCRLNIAKSTPGVE